MQVDLVNQQVKDFININRDMKVNDIIFIDNLPTLDLHAYDRDSARVKINEFINDNVVMKNEFVCVIHGIGSGILKKEVYNTLEKNKYVEDYKLFYNNTGCTIIKLKNNN